MPQPALHLLLADDSLRLWLQQPSAAPFDVHDRTARGAFLLGSLAPDMGFFPGGSAARDLSVAAHAGGSTDFARVLLGAGTDTMAAFGWGWMSHVLADARLHPLVSLGGAALLHDEGTRDPDVGMRLVAHIRVELGLEGWFSRERSTPPAVLREVFTVADLRPVEEAARTVLHLDLEPSALLAAQRAVINCVPFCEQLAALLASDLRRGLSHCSTDDFFRLPGVRRVASRLCAPTSPLFGFLNPVRPADWLLQRVQSEVTHFAGFFAELAAGGLEGVPNFDLNTGAHADPPGLSREIADAAA
jgi:hypothetical protein